MTRTRCRNPSAIPGHARAASPSPRRGPSPGRRGGRPRRSRADRRTPGWSRSPAPVKQPERLDLGRRQGLDRGQQPAAEPGPCRSGATISRPTHQRRRRSSRPRTPRRRAAGPAGRPGRCSAADDAAEVAERLGQRRQVEGAVEPSLGDERRPLQGQQLAGVGRRWRARSPGAPRSPGSRSGRCCRVRARACSRRHVGDPGRGGRRSSTSGHVEAAPARRLGVDAGPPAARRGRRACDSSVSDSGLPITPGSSRTTASMITSAAASPPFST